MAGDGFLNTIPLSETTRFIVDNRGKTAPTAEKGIALIATNCITNDHLYPLYEKVRFVSRETYDTWFRAHPKPGDILLTNKGSQNGAICLVPDPVNFVIAQDMVAIRANEEVIEPLFLFAALRSPDVQAQIKNLDVSGVIPHFKKTDFDKLLLPYPDRHTQKEIGRIYFELCAKVELNRRMNETLEAMARALFKSWFVDFDPVRAKAEGRDPGLPKPLADLFPDSFEDSELGETPKGWVAAEIQDCCAQIQNGGTPRRNEPRYWDGGNIPWLTSGEVRQPIVTATQGFITEAGLTESSAKRVPAYSTVIALYGATAGQVSLVASPLTTNQAVCALVPKKGFAFFNYLSMRAATSDLESKAVGSAQQNISKGIVQETQVILPLTPVIERFAMLVGPLFNRWIANLYQSRALGALRDTLVPKLISGDLRVNDAKRLVGRGPSALSEVPE